MSKEKRTSILQQIDRIEQQLDTWENYKYKDPAYLERLTRKKEHLYKKLWYDEL